MNEPLRIAFVPGVTPDKWSRIWRERFPRTPLELTLVEQDDQRAVLDDGRCDMSFVRLPVERDGLHLIPLYEEQPVVVVPLEHPVAAYDEIPLADLAAEQLVAGEVPGWDDLTTVTRLDFPDMTTKEAIEVVASGTGIVIVPMSVARLFHRKDVVHVPVLDVPLTRVGLAWPEAVEDPRLDDFIGVVRGRKANSSRGDATARTEQRADTKKPARKSPPKKATARKPGKRPSAPIRKRRR